MPQLFGVRLRLKEYNACMSIIIAAMGCVINDNKEVLLALRNDPQAPKVHHKWQLPGGGIENGETVQDAVIREVKEETGLRVSIISNKAAVIFGVINERKHTNNTRVLLVGFLCKVIGGTLGKDVSVETAHLQWFSYPDIPWKEALPGNREVIKELLNN